MVSAPQPTPPRPSLWRNRDYLLWFVGDFVADAGSAIRAFAMPLIALAVTGSLSQTGVVGFVTSAVSVGLMIPGGLIADRIDRKKLLLWGHVFGATTWSAGVGLYLAGALNFVTLVILAVLTGARSGLFAGASNAAIKQLVRDDQLTSAVAANQGREAVISLSSGPIGGLLLAISTIAPFVAQTIGHAIAWITTRLIRTDLRPRSEEDESTNWRAQLREGSAWLKDHPTAMWLIAIAAVLNLGLNGVLSGLILSLRHQGFTPATIGLVSSAIGIGMLLGSFAAPSIVKRVGLGMLFIGGIAWTVAFSALMGLSSWFPLILASAGLSALMLAPVNSGLSGYFMAMIPNSKMGAITSVMGIVNMGLAPFAPLLAGLGLEYFGHRPTMIGFISLFAVGWAISLLVPSIRSVGRPDEWETGAQNAS